MDFPVIDDIPAYVGQSGRSTIDPVRAGDPRIVGLPAEQDASYRFLRSRRGSWLYARTAGGLDWPVWLICQPGLEESVHSRSALAELARRLVLRRRASLSVDYEGDGHSDGEVATVGLGDWSDDVVDTMALWPRASVDTILGIRLGSLVAMSAARHLMPRRLVLVDPVTDGEAWFMQALRSNLTTQLTAYRKVMHSRTDMYERVLKGGGTCSLAGYDVGQRFVQSVVANTTISTAQGLSHLSDSVELHLVFSNDASFQSAAELMRLLGAEVAVRSIQGHEPPIWSEAAMSASTCEAFQAAMLSLLPA